MSRDSFNAVDDAGNRYTIYVRRSSIPTTNLSSSQHERVEGLSSFH